MLEEDILTEGFWPASSLGEVFVIVLGRTCESVLPASASCILLLLNVAGRLLLFCVWDS
jgi:hypothetical protein